MHGPVFTCHIFVPQQRLERRYTRHLLFREVHWCFNYNFRGNLGALHHVRAYGIQIIHSLPVPN